jgi:hypothetical protein
MADPQEHLLKWLQDAHSMEQQAEPDEVIKGSMASFAFKKTLKLRLIRRSLLPRTRSGTGPRGRYENRTWSRSEGWKRGYRNTCPESSTYFLTAMKMMSLLVESCWRCDANRIDTCKRDHGFARD